MKSINFVIVSLGCDCGCADEDIHRSDDATSTDQRDGDQGRGVLRHPLLDAGIQRMRELRAVVQNQVSGTKSSI